MRRPAVTLPLWVKLALFGSLGVAVTHAFHLVVSRGVASAAIAQAQEARALDIARLVARQASNPVLLNDLVALQEIVDQATDGKHLAWCFITREGEVLASSFPGGTPAALLNLSTSRSATGALIVRDEEDQYLDVSTPIMAGAAGDVRVGIDLRPLRQARHELGLLLGLVALATIVVASAAAFAVGRRVTKPVDELLLAADRFDPAAPDRPVDEHGNDELALLAHHFNRMMFRLHEAHDERQLAVRKSASSERLVALGSLVAGVAHEVNNPIAGLKNVHSTLRRGGLSTQKTEEYLELMGDSLARLEDIVGRLLAFGRPRPLVLKSVTLSSIMHDVARLVAPLLRTRKIALVELVASESDGLVAADRTQVGQALLNLVLNALYVTREAGEIRLRTRTRLGFRGISVEDDGPGIPPELRDRVLDPFFSTKPEGEGTGLGLTVTRTIADAHQGELDFEFPPSGGTIATLWLREAPEARLPAPAWLP